MTPGDVARVLTACALYDYRRISEADAAAWHAVLADLDVADALEAVRRHYRDSTERAMPAHIRRGVRDIRDDRRRVEARDRTALPSPYEADMGRQVRVERGLAACRDVLAPLAAHLAARSQPPDRALDQLREITAGPDWHPDTEEIADER